MTRKLFGRNSLIGWIGLATTFTVNAASRAEDQPQLRMPQAFLSPSQSVVATDITPEVGERSVLSTDGAIEIVRERYPDGSVKIERGVTLDAAGNYVNHGGWRMLTNQGNVVAEGQYDLGKRVGVWTRFYGRNESPVFDEFPFNRFKAPFVATANYTDGMMDGEWLIVDSEDHKCMQISLKMGQRHGPAITWLPNGKTFRQATYDLGVPVGDVLEMNNKTGELERSATYMDGRRVITKTTHYERSRQKKTEAMYLAAKSVQKSPDDFWNLRFAEYSTEGKDLRHGPAKAWFENGKQRLEGYYQQDMKCGTFTYWHPNGQVAASGEFKNDQFHGMWVWYHENGLKSSIGKYDSGALVGDWRWWNDEGRLTKNKTYDGSEHIAAKPGSSELEQIPTETDTALR